MSARSKTSKRKPAIRLRFWLGRRVRWVSGLLVASLLGSAVFADWWFCLPESATATYVGRQNCMVCHAQQAAQWAGSHHDLAMDRATPETVLGNFNDSELVHHGITSRMFRDGERYLVNTEGPDGELADFEITYVFGVEPLQQYMVEFDRRPEMSENEVSRLQVLRICWDTRRQRWFYLAPPDVDEKLEPDDDLHWTGIAQRWNNMCADCHSTNLQKNYDVRTRSYHTTFSEIDVSCESCHGPGSLHVEMAHSKSLFWDRKLGYGLARLKDPDPLHEIHTCAPCHSRRRVVSPNFEAGKNYYDYYSNDLLYEHAYHADGQIQDEVYVFGSYLQSKMYAKGIRCTDCHDPHTAGLKHEGNRVCTSCHQHPAGKYDTPAHHRHDTGSSGAQCVACHMPTTTYMDVDPRRDHSLRIPRPDLSVTLGTPNACTGCHLERAPLPAARRTALHEYSDWLEAARGGEQDVSTALKTADRWAADWLHQWYGPPDDETPHFAHTLSAARAGDVSVQGAVQQALTDLAGDRTQAAIVRATSLFELARLPSRQAARESAQLLDDQDPQVRTAAIGNLEGLPNHELVRHVAPLLEDPVRLVRSEAGRVLARLPRYLLRGPQRQSLEAALEEFESGVLVNNDRATAHLTLGVLEESRGNLSKARQAYQTAIHVEPQATGPRTNLAALYDQLAGRAEQQAAQMARVDPSRTEPLIDELRKHRREAERLRREELDLLARDARLAPDNAPIQYRYGLSLYLHGRFSEAETALRIAAELEPQTPDFLLALALFFQKQGRWSDALEFCRQLVTLRPNDATFQQLWRELQEQAAER